MHAQLCPMLCDPMDCSPPGSSVHGIFQARILEWVAIPFSRGSSRSRGQTWIGRWFFTTEPPGKPPTPPCWASPSELLADYTHCLWAVISWKECFGFFSWTVGLSSWLKIFSKPWCKQICCHPSITVPFTEHRQSWLSMILGNPRLFGMLKEHGLQLIATNWISP